MRVLGQVLLSLFWLFLIIVHCNGLKTKAYRLLQYDQNGVQYGSRRIALNHVLTLPTKSDELFRNIILVEYHKINEINVLDYVDVRGIGGILFVLPADYDSEVAAAQHDPTLHQAFTKLQEQLLEKALQMPVYFVFNNDQIQKVVDYVNNNDVVGSNTQSGYKVIVQGVKLPSVHKAPQQSLTNLWAFKPGAQGGSLSRAQGPTVALVTHMDSFSSVPGLSQGVNDNGSGVLAMIEVARMLSQIIKQANVQLKSNVLLLLAAGGRLSHSGIRSFLSQQSASFLDSIDYTLCLDTLSYPPNTPHTSHAHTLTNQSNLTHHPLHLVYSKPPKDAAVAHWYHTINTTASALGIPLQFTHKKVKLNTHTLAWPHETFASKHMLSATLTTKQLQGEHQTLRQPSLASRSIDVDYLALVVRLVTGVLLDGQFEGGSIEGGVDVAGLVAGNDSLDVRREFLAAGADALAGRRGMLGMSQQGELVANLARQVFKEGGYLYGDMAGWVDEAQSVDWYDGWEVDMHIALMPSLTGELSLLGCVVAYCVVVFVGCTLWFKGWGGFIEMGGGKAVSKQE